MTKPHPADHPRLTDPDCDHDSGHDRKHGHGHEHGHSHDHAPDSAHCADHPDPSAAILALDNVTYAYPGGGVVLRGVDFSLPTGQKLGLIGPNGSGKTTFFLVAMGLLKHSSGRVLHHGKPVENKEDLALLRRNVGLVFQNADDQLFSPTVLEDVAFGPLNLGKSAKEAKEIAMETLESLDLSGYANRVTHKLSGGEKRMAALASVLAMKPQALLLDEPTNDLAPDSRERLIKALNGLDLAMAIISHDWDFLDQTTQRVYAFTNGRIALDRHFAAHAHIHVHDHGALPHEHEDG